MTSPGDDDLDLGDDDDIVVADGERQDDEPPVVARMVIEIRSDGSRTIARGAMEEMETGQSVAIEARGDSPVQLAWSLARMIASTPAIARTTARALLQSGEPSRKSRPSRVRGLIRRLRGRGRGGADGDDP